MQLQYVNMGFGRVLKPFETPETVLLDAAGRPTWQQEDAMDDNALTLALRAVEKLR